MASHHCACMVSRNRRKRLVSYARSNDRARSELGRRRYSNVTPEEAQQRLRLTFRNFERQRPLPLKPILSEAIKLFGDGTIKEIKERGYDHITEYLDAQGYPSESVGTFKEANVNDLVLFILGAIVYKVRRKTGRDISIMREKELVSVDGETGGKEEFVLMDLLW